MPKKIKNWQSPTLKTHLTGRIRCGYRVVDLKICVSKSGRYIVILDEKVLFNGKDLNFAFETFTQAHDRLEEIWEMKTLKNR